MCHEEEKELFGAVAACHGDRRRCGYAHWRSLAVCAGALSGFCFADAAAMNAALVAAKGERSWDFWNE
jgi:hypothetical protein